MLLFPSTSVFFAVGLQTLVDVVRRFGIRWDLLLLQSVNFIAMALALYAFAFRPIMRIMDARREKIAEGLARTEEAAGKLREAERMSQQMIRNAEGKAQQIMAEAKRQAQNYAAEQQKLAQTRAEALLQEARTVIAQERERVLAEIRHGMSEMVADLAEQVLENQLGTAEREQYMRLTRAQLERKAAR
ncbi:MAG: F0F1 ATP synthase subunit B [Puniceicoccales bacterium]|jgi:F-type H+-transporting ATPase subunit b|nr:F0F1 ATP synthase subunit B [Puniceicoccales bacterium]